MPERILRCVPRPCGRISRVQVALLSLRWHHQRANQAHPVPRRTTRMDPAESSCRSAQGSRRLPPVLLAADWP